MTRIDFYIGKDNGDVDPFRIACRLADKAYQMGHKVYIHTRSHDDAVTIDNLLWTFRDGSFIPHSLSEQDPDIDDPVIIGYQPDANQVPQHCHDVLINLTDEVPAFFSRFERIAEIVGQSEDAKSRARQRYRHYQDRGYGLDTHKI